MGKDNITGVVIFYLVFLIGFYFSLLIYLLIIFWG